jgi:hypothetical protein
MSKKESKEAVERLFAALFFDVISAMVNAASVERQFKGIHGVVKGLTKDEIRRVSVTAAKYYAEHAELSPNEMTKSQIESLKRKALEFALKTRSDRKVPLA